MEKRETKTTLVTPDGMKDVRVIIDFTPEDLVEHMCRCALAEKSQGGVYKSMKDNCILNRDLKRLLIIRSK